MSHLPVAAPRRFTRNLLVAGAIMATVGIAVGACSTPASSPAPPGAQAPGAQDAGPNATSASFTARTLDGEQVAVPGSRPSVLFFFSIECGACGPSTEALAKAQQAVGDKANFVAVDVAGYETAEDVKGFLNAYQATNFAYAIDTDAKWITNFKVNQLSTALVLDASGKEVFRAVEPSTEQVQAELAKVMA